MSWDVSNGGRTSHLAQGWKQLMVLFAKELHSSGQALILSSTGNRRLDFSASMDGFFDEIGCASFCVCVCWDYSTSCAAIVVVVRLDCFRPTPDSVFYVNSTIAVIALVPSRSTDCSPSTLR